MKEIWDLGTLQVFLSNTGITTGSPCLFSSSVCGANTQRSQWSDNSEGTCRLKLNLQLRVWEAVKGMNYTNQWSKEINASLLLQIQMFAAFYCILLLNWALALSPHLCKVLLRDPSGPLDAELERSAGVCHICTLDQHPLYQQTVLWRVPDVGLTVTVAVHALQERHERHKHYAHTGKYYMHTVFLLIHTFTESSQQHLFMCL